MVPRATTGVAEVALPISSYVSAPVDNLDPQGSGTDITGLPPATVTDPSCRPAPCPAPKERVELQPGDWQPSLAWQSADVRDTAHAAQEAATSSARLLSSPSSTSSSSTTPSPGTPVPAHADDATDKAALAARPRVSMDAPEHPGDATTNPAQTNATPASAASDAMSSIPPDATLPPDDAFEASNVSVETVSSSNCDPQSLEEAPIIAAPDLAAQNVTDVLLADLNAPLVTISLEEKALAPYPSCGSLILNGCLKLSGTAPARGSTDS